MHGSVASAAGFLLARVACAEVVSLLYGKSKSPPCRLSARRFSAVRTRGKGRAPLVLLCCKGSFTPKNAQDFGRRGSRAQRTRAHAF